jgi:hypothetical protein
MTSTLRDVTCGRRFRMLGLVWGPKSVHTADQADLQAERSLDPVGFANSGGLVFVDESAEHIALA